MTLDICMIVIIFVPSVFDSNFVDPPKAMHQSQTVQLVTFAILSALFLVFMNLEGGYYVKSIIIFFRTCLLIFFPFHLQIKTNSVAIPQYFPCTGIIRVQ